MALYPCVAEMLLRITTQYQLSGKFAALGRNIPVMGVTRDFMKSLEGKYGAKLNVAAHLDPSGLLNDDKELFSMLGFESAEAIDVTDAEGAEYVIDLNRCVEDKGLFEKFDVIQNNGTLEHVFHVPNFLASITRMLRTGGHVIHFVPMNNWVDHGFYQVSPTLLTDYYLDNNFAVKECRIYRYKFGAGHRLLDLEYVTDGNYFSVQHKTNNLMGRFDSGLYGYVFIAQKTKESTTDAIPMQSVYASEEQKRERLKKLGL